MTGIKNKLWAAAMLLFVLNTLLVAYYLYSKNAFHVDEGFSYGHANSTQGAFLSQEIDSFIYRKIDVLYHNWMDGRVFHDYLTVQPAEQFKYGHIWQNLASGVHPPLFYVILHTVCSFFPEKFSKWQAGGINLVVFFLTLVMLFKLSKLFLKETPAALLPVFLYGFSNAGIGTAVFLRMYMLQTLWAVCLVYETTKMIQDNAADKRRLMLIFLYSALGILTQYVSIIISFVAAATASMVLLWRRNYGLLMKYAFVMALSAAVLFVIFPPAFSVLRHSQRGEQVAGLATVFAKNLFYVAVNRFGRFSHVLMTELLSLPQVYDKAAFLILIMGSAAIILNRNGERATGIFWLFLAVFIISLCICFFMPKMYIYDLRYFMPVMPLCSLLLVYFAVELGKSFNLSKAFGVALAFLVVLNTAAADFAGRSSFAFQNRTEENLFFGESVGKRLFIQPGWKFGFFDHVFYVQHAEAVFAAEDLCSGEALWQIKQAKAGTLVVIHHLHGYMNMQLFLKEPNILCDPLREYLKFKYVVRIGMAFYDVYEVTSGSSI